MGFDFVSQLQGPQIDIGLYGDAALKGAQVGAMTPTPFAAATEGLMKGLVTGANLYNTAADNVRDDEALEVAKKNAETSAAQAKAQEEYQKQRIEVEKQQLALQQQQEARLAAYSAAQTKLEEAKQQEAAKRLQEDTLRKSATADMIIGLNDGTLSAEKVLNDSRYVPILTEGTKESDYLLGYLAQKTTDPATRKKLADIGGFKETVRAEQELAKTEAGRKDLAKENYLASRKKLIESGEVPQAINVLDHSAFYGNDIQVYPSYKDPHNNNQPSDEASWKASSPTAYNVYVKDTLAGSVSKENANLINNTKTNAAIMAGKTYDSLYGSANKKTLTTEDKLRQSLDQQMMGAVSTEAPQNKAAFNAVSAQKALASEGFDPERLQTYSNAMTQDRATYIDSSPTLSKAAYAATGMLSALEPDLKTDGSWATYVKMKAFKIASAVSAIDGDATENARNFVVQDFVNRRIAQVDELRKSADPQAKEALADFQDRTGVDPTNKEDLKEYYSFYAEAKLAGYERGVTQNLQSENEIDLKAISKARTVYSYDPIANMTARKQAEELVSRAKSTANTPVSTSAQPTTTDKVTGLTKTQTSAFNKIQMDPAFAQSSDDVKAIALVENSGRVKDAQVSPEGTIGPMQVISDTAKEYALRYNLSNSSPEDQIKIAELHLADLTGSITSKIIQDTGHMPDSHNLKMLTYAAYNGGEPVLYEAMRQAGSTDWNVVKKYIKTALPVVAAKNPKVLGGYTVERRNEILVAYPDKVLRGYNAIVSNG